VTLLQNPASYTNTPGISGIIANVGDGGNEGDIKLVEKLAQSYISRPDCIVLLVISCESEGESWRDPFSVPTNLVNSS
jgi:hypothetical protein